MWGALGGAAEFSYPAAQCPIGDMCAGLANGTAAHGVLGGVAALLLAGAPYLFSTGPAGGSCLNMTYTRAYNDRPAPGWDYLACTEIVHPIGSNNVSDFLPPSPWSVDGTAAWCAPQFGAAMLPRPRHVPDAFGLYQLGRFARAASRVLFTYGLRDPWHTMGVGLANLSASLPVVTAADGAHCSDMEGAMSHDTPAMLRARAQAAAILREWLGSW